MMPPQVLKNTDFQSIRRSIRQNAYGRAIEFCLCLIGSLFALSVYAQSTAPAAAESETTPSETAAPMLSVVRWAATLPEAAGRTVELHFALYQNQAGGLALWSETQTVQVAADGRYSVLLGATSAEGLPQSLFAAGQARWVEAQLVSSASPDASAQTVASTRTLLAAVPYAFKSLDSETLAGRAATDYVTREDLQSAVAGSVANKHSSPQSSATAVTGIGTSGYLPVWTGTSTLGNSMIAESGAKVGIGTVSPATTLDVNGAATLRGAVSFLKPVTFAGAQTFPGTVKAVTATSPISASTTAGAVTVGLSTTSLESTLNSVYARLGAANTFSKPIAFAAGQSFPGVVTTTKANSTYAQLAAPNTFTKPISFVAGQSFPGVVTTATANSTYARLGAANTFTKPITFSKTIKVQGSGNGIGYPDGSVQTSAIRHGRVSSSASNYECVGTIPWNPAFSDTNYTVVCSNEGSASDDNYSLQVTSRTASSVTVTISECVGSVTFHCIAIHD